MKWRVFLLVAFVEALSFRHVHAKHSNHFLSHVVKKAHQLPQDSFDDNALDIGGYTTNSSGGCRPVCRWSCISSECEETCEPLCAGPVCETRCPSIDVGECSETCDEPDCTVICPQTHCAMGHCPICTTVCNKPTCTVQCVAPLCDSVCADPKCEWKCKDPEVCPEPQCTMKCEPVTGCMMSGPPNALPPNLDRTTMSHGVAKLGDVPSVESPGASAAA